MTRHKAPTIAEQGGLEAHMTNLGINYKLFKQLRSFPAQTNTSIAAALTQDRGSDKKVFPATVKFWCIVDEEEENHEP